jgi:hypothetical protein
MMVKIPNGAIYLFNRTFGPKGKTVWTEEKHLPNPLLPTKAPTIDPPPVDPPAKGR